MKIKHSQNPIPEAKATPTFAVFSQRGDWASSLGHRAPGLGECRQQTQAKGGGISKLSSECGSVQSFLTGGCDPDVNVVSVGF